MCKIVGKFKCNESLITEDRIRVVQTYHGNGGKEGYRYQVEKFVKDKGKYIYTGDIVEFPLYNRLVSLDGIPKSNSPRINSLGFYFIEINMK